MSFILSSQGDNLLQQALLGVLPKVVVTTFRLFSGANYPVTAGTTPIGNEVYSGTVSSVNRASDTSVGVVLEVPPQISSLVFGSIALYTSTGVLFAVHAYPFQVTIYAAELSFAHIFKLRGKVPITTSVTLTVNTSASGYFSMGSYSPADTPPSVGAGKVWQLTSSTAPSVQLVSSNSGTSWVPSDYTQIQTGLLPASVSLVSGFTTITTPIGSVFDSTPTLMTGRYLFVGPSAQVARVTSIVNGPTVHTITLDGNYSWVTTSSAIEVWSLVDLDLDGHTSLNQPSAHVQYMTPAILDPLYTPSSHVTAADPHSQYLLDSAAVSGVLSLTPLSHLVSSNPHSEYILLTTAASSFVSSAVNTYHQDTSNVSRLRMVQDPDQSQSTTVLIGGAETLNLRRSVVEFVGSSPTPLMAVTIDGVTQSPMVDLPVTDVSKSLAYSSWVSNRLSQPGPRVLRSASGVSPPDAPLLTFDGYHVYTGDYVRFLDINTVMDPNGVYELMFNVVSGPDARGIELQPNDGLSLPQFHTNRIPRRALDQTWTIYPTTPRYGSRLGVAEPSDPTFGNPAPGQSLSYDEVHNEDEKVYMFQDWGTEEAQSLRAEVDFAGAPGTDFFGQQAILQIGCNRLGSGFQLKKDFLSLSLVDVPFWTPFQGTLISSVATPSISGGGVWYKLEFILNVDVNAGNTSAVGRLWNSDKTQLIAEVTGTFSRTAIERYAGYVNGHPRDLSPYGKTVYDNLIVTSDFPPVGMTDFRMVVPMRAPSFITGVFNASPSNQQSNPFNYYNQRVAGRLTIRPAQGSFDYTVSTGADVAHGSCRAISPFTWTRIGRLGTRASWSSASSAGYKWWAAVRRIY